MSAGRHFREPTYTKTNIGLNEHPTWQGAASQPSIGRLHTGEPFLAILLKACPRMRYGGGESQAGQAEVPAAKSARGVPKWQAQLQCEQWLEAEALRN